MNKNTKQTGSIRMNNNIPEIMKPSEIASYLKISKNTVYSMLAQGTLKGFHVGNNKLWRVHKEDFLEYLDNTKYNNWN